MRNSVPIKVGMYCFLLIIFFIGVLIAENTPNLPVENKNDIFLKSLVRVYLKLKGSDGKYSSKVNGIIVSNDGYILTTNYLFYKVDEEKNEIVEVDYEKILIEFHNFKVVEAEYIARDEKGDLVLLKVNGSFTDFITFKNIELKTADEVRVMSLWLYTPTINKTNGIVSNTERFKGCAYQIDAKVDFASIGGLVTDKDNNPVGIVSFLDKVSAKNYGWGMNSGIGFATKSKCILKSIDDLKKGKNVVAESVPILGVQGDIGIVDILGAKIKKVAPNTPAYKAGIKDGDVVIKYNDKIVTEWLDLTNFVRQTPLNSKVTLEIIRDDKKITIEIVLDKKRKEFVK